MTRAGKVVVRMRGVTKRFPGVLALDQVELDVRAGEVHVLLGENGAGKSTLMKILCGQYRADEGSVWLDEQPIRPASPQEAAQLGLVMIHQELTLLDGLTVAENISLGHEHSRAGLLDRKREAQGAESLLARLHCRVAPALPVKDLSVAEKQVVEIAKALRHQTRVLVMDEPTASLADDEIQHLFEVIRTLCAQGVAVIYISHRMEEIFTIGDRVTVLRDGANVATRQVRQTSRDELICMMVGRSIEAQIPKRSVPFGREVLRVVDIERLGVLQPTCLTLRAGEILGVGGLMGSGRSELARAVFGADPIDAGEVLVDGEPVHPHNPRGAIAAGLGLITEDRKDQGLLLGRSVLENTTLTILPALSRGQLLQLARERTLAQDLVTRMHIRIASLDQKVVDLSGGNQQKVILARWLAAQCKVLILDEPTRGIDVGAKAEIYQLLGELVAQGVGILLISSELPELLGLADRVAVMCEGRLAGIVERCDASQQQVMTLAVGQRAARAATDTGPG